MKIVHLSTNQNTGGAAKAAYKIHNSCIENGLDSSLLVQKKITNDKSTIDVNDIQKNLFNAQINSRLNALPLKIYQKRKINNFSPSFFSFLSVKNNNYLKKADIIVIYWICEGFLSIREIGELLKLGKPILWRLSDMWPFTGGCHYSYGCTKYETLCGKCFQLNSQSNYDLSRLTLKNKIKFWKNTDNLTLIAPSKWIKKCASKSSVFRNTKIELIHTGVDNKIFYPKDKYNCRKSLRLSHDKKLILFGSINPFKDDRKGGNLLFKALTKLKNMENVELTIFGERASKNYFKNYKLNNFGVITDDIRMSMIYSAADIFVAPSIEENLANTVLEALMSGIPVVAFNIGGMPDAIEHKINGYLAKPFDVDDLARGITWALENKNEFKKIFYDRFVKRFSQKHSMEKNIMLYNKLFKKYSDEKI